MKNPMSEATLADAEQHNLDFQATGLNQNILNPVRRDGDALIDRCLMSWGQFLEFGGDGLEVASPHLPQQLFPRGAQVRLSQLIHVERTKQMDRVKRRSEATKDRPEATKSTGMTCQRQQQVLGVTKQTRLNNPHGQNGALVHPQ